MFNRPVAVAITLATLLTGCTSNYENRSKRTEIDPSDSDVPTLRPDLPDSTSVRFSLRLDVNVGDAETMFAPTPADQIRSETADTTLVTVTNWLVTAEDSGVFNPELFVDIDWISDQQDYNDVSRTINALNPQAVWWQYLRGNRLRFLPRGVDADNDTPNYEYVSSFTPVVHGPPGLFLVDHYTLSNFVGDYGTGRIVNTFSLLPGETTELRVSTYRDESLSSRSTASILDSSSNESTDSFLEALSDTTTKDTSNQSSSTDARFNAKGSYSAIFSSAEASTDANINNTSNSRRDFHSNVASSVSSTANRASASRDVYVDTSVESTVEQGREDVSIRTISNINTGHTLNFISYQMNQEYHSILHLTRVEVGFDDGRGNVYTLPLYELDRLIARFVIESERDNVRDVVIGELAAITDYKGDIHPDFVIGKLATAAPSAAEATLNGRQTYSVNYDYRSGYTITGHDSQLSVPGIIVDVQPVVMRTDGIYVESLVGRSSAWDSYTEQLKAKELRSK